MPNFVYTRDIPDGPHNPSTDQPDMKINTNSTDSLIGTDHYSFNDNDGGLHKQSTYPRLLVAPTTAALQGAVYTKDVGLGVTQLFYRRESNGTEIQLTGPLTPSAATNGYTFLPGGLLLQWGTVSQAFASGSTTGTVTFATANIAFPNNCFVVTGNPLVSFASLPSSQASVNIRQSTVSATSFQWQFFTGSNQYIGFFWTAIGN